MPKPQWSKWEEQVANDIAGQCTPGSGNKWNKKGDVRAKDWIASCKSTARDSFSISRIDLDEIEKIAMADNKSMILAIDINGKQYAVVEWNTFCMLHDSLGAY